MGLSGQSWQIRTIEINFTKALQMNNLICFLSIFVLCSTVQADQVTHAHTSKYAGEEQRSIKSLSPDDIAQLRSGSGWGLAKAAELNGMPGPIHLLEIKEKIPLTDDQISVVEAAYQQMKAQAIQQGERLIELEQELELLFRTGSVTQDALRASLSRIAQQRMELRFTHLSAHLKMPGILSKDQIRKYNAIRGYSKQDPCTNVPQGHNAEMWRKHNGCQ